MSSNATSARPCFRRVLAACALGLASVAGAPLAAQDDTAATPAPAPASPRPVTDVLVTVPRSDINPAELQECRDEADAGTISGEIVVCREVGDRGESPLTGDRDATQKRYAEETAFRDAPRPPDMFGIPDNGRGTSFGGAPPPALIIDVEALPKAPAGSDADRIARGLPPLDQEGELTEEEEKARREAEGIKTTVPARPAKKKKG